MTRPRWTPGQTPPHAARGAELVGAPGDRPASPQYPAPEVLPPRSHRPAQRATLAAVGTRPSVAGPALGDARFPCHWGGPCPPPPPHTQAHERLREPLVGIGSITFTCGRLPLAGLSQQNTRLQQVHT